MRKYKAIVAYDGTDFYGWQVQPSHSTVAEALQKAFFSAFLQPVTVLGASRTDAGVHALGQVALCTTTFDLDPLCLSHAWNNCLPKSIVIRSLEIADPLFHPFAHVVQKTYYYHLFVKRPLPFVARYGWFWRFVDRVDWEKFGKAMYLFVGEHDFRSFCKHELGQTTVRTIDSIDIKKFSRFGMIRIEIKSKGFLRYQIRRMVGAALDVASKQKMPVDFVKKQLDYPSDQQELLKAEGCGLCLRKIVYGQKYE